MSKSDDLISELFARLFKFVLLCMVRWDADSNIKCIKCGKPTFVKGGRLPQGIYEYDIGGKILVDMVMCKVHDEENGTSNAIGGKGPKYADYLGVVYEPYCRVCGPSFQSPGQYTGTITKSELDNMCKDSHE